ncbi:uncharacterized protein LOC132262632 [Phlebotomus argentipes]|uniref:uncharacterized protein LOC132262632 n=1 Tax=Phlebotomus argentipes TaxID=94469 RepID=UPI002892FF6D|nr:uncharacterized protein LOC132262632 [Phlebotomus argentipes]
MAEVRHISDLSYEEKIVFLRSFDTIMTDCDGVLWSALRDIPGIGAALNALEASGKRIIYVSNNSTRPAEEYKEKISKLGVQFKYENLVHPMLSIIYYLRKINFQGLIYVIGTTHTKNLIREAGFKVLDGPNGEVEEDYMKLLKRVHDGESVKMVIFDNDLNFNYAKFMRADLYLQNPECKLIVGANDYRLPVSQDFDLPGPGPFVDAMLSSLAPGKKPIVLGKPGKELGEVLKEQFDIKDPKRVLFVGDMINTDIKFARNVGFQSLLVLSGGTSREKMQANKDDGVIPDFFADSLADLRSVFHGLAMN